MSPRILTCLSIVALGAGGAVACKPKPAGDARQEAAEKGHEAGRGEGESVHDRVRLGEEAFQGLKLVFAKVEEKELAPSLEVAAELVPDPDRRAEVCARAPARGRGS